MDRPGTPRREKTISKGKGMDKKTEEMFKFNRTTHLCERNVKEQFQLQLLLG